MIAKIERNTGKQFILTLVPEKEDDAQDVQRFAEELRRGHSIFFRGYQYRKNEVEFLIQANGGGID